MAREAGVVQEVFNEMMSGLWGFIPLSRADAHGFLMECARRVPPNLFIIAEHEGKPMGMLVSFPYATPLRGGSGGKVRLAIGGISPGYRGMGIHRLVLNEMYRQLFHLGFTEGEASQVAESNENVKMKVLKPVLGDEIIKIFRVYKRKLK
jgi:GNAT superfamily N-acetyltransferase